MIHEEEEELPDRLEMTVQAGTGENLDCVCEAVGEDPKSKHYQCTYQVKPNGESNGAAGGIEGRFDMNLPYVKPSRKEPPISDAFAGRKRLT